MIDKMYNYFVRRNSNVQYEYERYVQEHLLEHYESRIKQWKILMKLNWHYAVKKKETPLLYWDVLTMNSNENNTQMILPQENSIKVVESVKSDIVQEKKKNKPDISLPYLRGAESRSTKWIPPHDMVRQLMNYDIISFDIFDTLIFRPLSSPQDLFKMLGAQLNVLDFINIRLNAERRIREEKYKKYGHRELTIEEIYERIEKETGLEAQREKNEEIEMEYNLCFANPYMKYVFDTILGQGKRIILVSDMYIQGKDLKRILEKCGYKEYEKLFVSCDYSCSKRDGGLYEAVKEYIGNDKKYIHVGDNQVSDIECANKAGIDTFYYENVNRKGKKYRATDMSDMIGSAYGGIINSHIHNGYKRYDAFYEYGYIYGGLFMFGYAQYIHEFAMNHNINKVIFVARDGYIIKKVYDSLFNDENTEYMLCSRISNLKLAAYSNKNDYIKEFISRWIVEGKTISMKNILANMDLQSMENILQKYVDLDEVITKDNVGKLIKFVNENWNAIVKEYEKNIQLSKKYYKRFFDNNKKVLIVDIGWRGQGVLALRNLERDYWHFGCEIYGMLAASAPTKACIGQLQSGIINTYMFSPISNISCFKVHSTNSINNILLELFAGAPSPSFRGFEKKDDDYDLIFDVPETANYELIRKIHSGIMDFVEEYKKYFEKYEYMYKISGYDAYMPIRHIFKNYSYIKRFFGKYEFQDCVGGTEGNSSRTIKDIFIKFNL